MEDDLLKTGLKCVYHTLSFKVLSQVFILLGSIILIRALTKHDYGIYNLLYSMIGIIGTVASFGISNVLYRYTPEYFRRGEFILGTKLVKGASALRLSTSVMILCLVLFLWDYFAPLLKIHHYKNYFVFFTFIILTYQQWMLLKIVLESHFLHKYTQGGYSLFALLKLLGYLSVLCYGAGLFWVLCVDLFSCVVLLGIHFLSYLKRIPKHEGRRKSFDTDEKKRILRYAFYYNFGDMGTQFIYTNTDHFIIAFFLDPVAVGVYAFCVRITKMIARFSPVGYLSELIRPLFVSIGVTSNKQQIRMMYEVLVKYTYVFYIPVFFFVALSCRDLVEVVFGKYAEHTKILITGFGFATLNAVALPTGLVAQLRERADIIMFSKIFGIYNILADIILIKLWGIMGAVIATGTAELLKNAFISWYVRDYLSFRNIGMFLLKTLAYWSVWYAVLKNVFQMSSDPVINLLVSLSVFAALFLFYMLVIFSLSGEEKKLIMIVRQEDKMPRLIQRLINSWSE